MCIFTQFDSMIMYFVLTLIMGIFSSIARASGIAIRTERGRIYGMGAATGAFTASLSFGQVIGPVVFGIIADSFSISTAFIIGGIVGLIGTMVSTAFLKIKTDY